MTTLRVGMRVRIVACYQPRNAHLIGREARILRRVEVFGQIGWVCDDGPGYWTADCLSPILDPGAQPSEYATLAELLESLEVEA